MPCIPIRTAGKSFIGEQTVSKRTAVSLANKTEEGLIKIKCTGTEELPLDKIKEFQGALKKRTKAQKEKLLESLKTYGFSFPFFIWKNEGINWCLDGHGRLEVLNSLLNKDQLPTFPVVYVQAEDEAEAKKKLLQLNSQYGEIDTEGLQEFIDGIDIDMSEFEIPGINLDGLIEPKEEGAIPEVEEGEPICKLGDIWQLGNHRLMCGDSTKEEDVAKLMNGNKADMVFTDPPYGMNLDTDYSKMTGNGRKGKTYDKVIGDNEDFKDDLIETVFNNFNYCNEIFLWGVDYYFDLIPNFKNGNLIVWDKTLQTNGDADYNSEFELLWTKNQHKKEVIHFNWFRYFGLSQQDIKTREHPTQKPLQVITPFIEKYSNENNVIVDIYGGSGSTLIACEQLNRKCYMMELDEKYCDVIIKRWENYTGEKAVKING